MSSSRPCPKCKTMLPIAFRFCPNCGAEVNPQPKPKVKRRPKGSGSVFKVQGNRTAPWVAKKCGKLLGYFPDRPSAEKFLAEHQTNNPHTINTTLKQIHERWQATRAYQQLTKGSQSNYRIVWDKLKPLHNTAMRKVKTSDFQAIINHASKSGCGRDGCAKIKTLSSLLCIEAMKDDIIDRNYALSIELPEYVQEFKRRNLTDEEIIMLLYHDDNRDVRTILTMLYTSTRISELFGIEKNKVFLDKGYMTGGSKSDAGRDRIIPIRKEILPYVQSFMQEPGRYLISSPTGKQTNSNNFRNRSFYVALELCGINYKDKDDNNVITPHRMRHTYIAESIKAGH